MVLRAYSQIFHGDEEIELRNAMCIVNEVFQDQLLMNSMNLQPKSTGQSHKSRHVMKPIFEENEDCRIESWP